MCVYNNIKVTNKDFKNVQNKQKWPVRHNENLKSVLTDCYSLFKVLMSVTQYLACATGHCKTVILAPCRFYSIHCWPLLEPNELFTTLRTWVKNPPSLLFVLFSIVSFLALVLIPRRGILCPKKNHTTTKSLLRPRNFVGYRVSGPSTFIWVLFCHSMFRHCHSTTAKSYYSICFESEAKPFLYKLWTVWVWMVPLQGPVCSNVHAKFIYISLIWGF